MKEKKPNICFVAQNSYGALAEIDPQFIGGIEVQVPMMARWFSTRGYPVTMICWDEGYGEERLVEGIRVISMCRRGAGIPGFRFLYPRWTSLNKALAKADPDVIYYNYGDLEFGQIVYWARRHKVPVLYSVANSMVCLRDLPSLKPYREKLLYRYGLTRADSIIAQTLEEQLLLEKNFKLESTVIPMPNPGFADRVSLEKSFSKDGVRILWVGRFSEEKRLEWFFDLAESLPEYQFDVVGGASIDTSYSSDLISRAQAIPNLRLYGKVRQGDMGRFYGKATLLCSTSSFEGFPNVFIEAWSVGLPIVATIDPDGLVERLGIGVIGSTRMELVRGIQHLLDQDRWQVASNNAISYYESTHRPELVMSQFESEILALTSPPKQQDPKSGNPSLCLIAHNAYGVLAGENTSHVGGIEVQVPMMSRWFAKEGYRTTMVSWDSGYDDGIEHEGVTVRKLCKESDGFPMLRFIHPRWTSLTGALKRAEADVYYYNCGDLGLGQVVQWAHMHKKKVLYSIANDVDCVQELPALKPLRERVLYRHGLMNVDKIVCQTEHQKTLLEDEFGVMADVIRMPCEGFEKTLSADAVFDGAPKHILWAGRFTPEKRLEYFFELARHFPEMIFDVIGDFNFEKDTGYADKMKEMAQSIDNVVLHGRIPHEKMGEYFNRSFLLCSTSVYEGFPNIYLEAWSVGLPLITTFDPDGVVGKYGLGQTVKDVEGMRRAIESLLVAERWNEASKAVESYFFQNHTLDASMKKFEDVLTKMY